MNFQKRCIKIREDILFLNSAYQYFTAYLQTYNYEILKANEKEYIKECKDICKKYGLTLNDDDFLNSLFNNINELVKKIIK